MIRRGDGTTQIWHRAADEWISADLSKTNVKKLNALLPRPFEMRSDLPLPDQVPIAYLAEASLTRAAGRKQRHAVVRAVAQLTDKLRNADSVKSSAEQIAAALGHLDTPSERLDEDELQLARDLLLKIAGIGPAHFADLLG